MAVVTKVRYKPDLLRSSLETLIEGFNPTTGQGTLVFTVQLICYDDANVNVATYEPGDIATEKYITILYEDTLRFDLAILGAKNRTNIKADLQAAIDAWALSVKPAANALEKVARSARRLSPSDLPA